MAYIAAAELPANQWPDLIQRLLGNVSGMQSTETVKEASLEAVGYICEELVSWLVFGNSYETTSKLNTLVIPNAMLSYVTGILERLH